VVWNVWGPVILTSIPFAIASWIMEAFHPAHSLAGFFLQIIATLPVFFLTVALIFRSFVRSQVLPKIRSMFFAEAR
jgi:hypothetical protein